MASTSQKRANRTYGEKCVQKTVKYTPNEMNEYDELEKYLEESGSTFSGLVKQLLKEHIKQTKEQPQKVVSIKMYRVEDIKDKCFMAEPFYNIEVEKLEYLYEHFSKEVIEEIMEYAMEHIKDDMYYGWGYFEDYGNRFDEWVEDVVSDMINENEFKDCTQKEIAKKLKKSLDENGLLSVEA